MSETNKRILLGRIVSAHGIRGDVLVKSYAAVPEDIAAYGVLSDGAGLRKLRLKVLRATAKGVVCHVTGVDDRNGAEALAGVDLFVERARLPALLEGEYYHVDLIGLAAVDAHGCVIGEVVGVQNYGASDLLEVRIEGQKATELVPLTEEFVPSVDLRAGRVIIAVPQHAAEEEGE